MKKIFLAVAIFLFFSPFTVQADTDGVRNNLNNAANSASEAALYARKAYETFVLEEAQYNARKAEKAAAEAQSAIQNAISDLG